MKEDLLQATTVRLPVPLYRQLSDAAHAARVPVAVYLRRLLAQLALVAEEAGLPLGALLAKELGGVIPSPAPPPLGPAALRLLTVLRRLASNLTQLHAHAAAAGDPLARLTREGGEIDQLAAARTRLETQLELGELDPAAVADWTQRLDQPGHAVNALALLLNKNQAPAPAAWLEALQALHEQLQRVPTAE